MPNPHVVSVVCPLLPQTLIILALVWHVSSWVTTSARMLILRYSMVG